MEIINRVRVEIGTGRYTISTNEPEEYVLELARGINEKLEEVMGANGTLSQSDALILCLLGWIMPTGRRRASRAPTTSATS